MTIFLMLVTAVSVPTLIVAAHYVFKKNKSMQLDNIPKDRSLRGLINDIGTGDIYYHRECQSYHLIDPDTKKTHTVYVGTSRQFDNTKRFRITYTTLLTPIGSALDLHSRLYVMSMGLNNIDLLKRLISNTKVKYLPLQIVNEGAICNGGVFVESSELEDQQRPMDEVNYY